MAKHRALKIGATVPVAQMEATDAVDNPVNVSGPNKILGRTTTGEGGHEELTISGLPAETTPASGDLLLIEVAGVLSKLDIAYLPGGGGGAVATDAIWDAKGDLAVGTGANAAEKLAVGTDGHALIADSAQATGLKYAPVMADVQVFTSNGTWTKPTGAKMVEALVVGGGGGGGSGRKGAAGSVRCAGGGGGSGGRSTAFFQPGNITATVSITVGQAGSGGAAVSANSTSGNIGTAGSPSSFGDYLVALGGGAGAGGTASTGTGGSGGSGLVSTGGAGAAASASGGTGSSSPQPNYASSGGGSGGGITTGDAASSGQTGRVNALFRGNVFSANGGAIGTNGSAGGVDDGSHTAQGGGGGGSSVSGNAGSGGNGGGYGAGGGSGGAAVDSVGNSGAGGAGSGGVVVVITYF